MRARRVRVSVRGEGIKTWSEAMRVMERACAW